MMEQLDKGLIDFGLVYGTVDRSKYESMEIPIKDIFGVLMRKDSPLAKRNGSLPKICGISRSLYPVRRRATDGRSCRKSGGMFPG